MSDITNKTGVRIPLAALISVLCAVASGGAVFGVMQYKKDEALSKVGAVEAASIDRDSRLEKRVEKLEDIAAANRAMLGRIDERTANISAAVSDMKAQLSRHMEQK